MNQDPENAKIIIAMLDKNAISMDKLTEEIHSISDEVKGVSVYFSGMSPQVHILDHAKLTEIIADKKDVAKATRNALYSVIGSIFTAVVLAVGAYFITASQAELKAQVAEIAKAQIVVPKKEEKAR